jgi:hypothetical protein
MPSIAKNIQNFLINNPQALFNSEKIYKNYLKNFGHVNKPQISLQLTRLYRRGIVKKKPTPSTG